MAVDVDVATATIVMIAMKASDFTLRVLIGTGSTAYHCPMTPFPSRNTMSIPAAYTGRWRLRLGRCAPPSTPWVTEEKVRAMGVRSEEPTINVGDEEQEGKTAQKHVLYSIIVT